MLNEIINCLKYLKFQQNTTRKMVNWHGKIDTEISLKLCQTDFGTLFGMEK